MTSGAAVHLRHGREEESDDDDQLLDDGWVQRDETKQRIAQRLKRTGYTHWRKSLDAASRYELEKALPAALRDIEEEEECTRRVAAPAPAPVPVPAPVLGSGSALWPNIIDSPSSPRRLVSPRVGGSPRTTPRSTGGKGASRLEAARSISARVLRRRSAGVVHGKELNHALQREAEAAGGNGKDEWATLTIGNERGDGRSASDRSVATKPETTNAGPAAKKDKKDKKDKRKDRRWKGTGESACERKGKSPFLLWRKNEHNRSRVSVDEGVRNEETREQDSGEPQQVERRGQEAELQHKQQAETEAAKRDRSGTTAFYAAMSAGYLKQQQQQYQEG